MNPRRLLLVSKRTGLERWPAEDIDRMVTAGVLERDRLAESQACHDQTLGQVGEVLANHQVERCFLDEVDHARVAEAELVVSIGGDGTALSVHRFLRDTPLLSVNSDPKRSVGHYTRCNGPTFARIFDQWLSDEHRLELLPRLCLEIENEDRRLVLNDCLICNSNPGSMSRYRLRLGTDEETQQSSGVWISTASGSTGAISSAGMTPVDASTASLLYLVREPFLGRGTIRLARGIQQPPRGIQVIAGPPGLAAYVDGDPASIAIPPGLTARLGDADQPLKLVRGS